MNAMKPVLLSISCLIFFACNNKSADTKNISDEVATDTVEETVTVVEPDSAETDAITAATGQVPNTSFNGMIMIPPQYHATVTLIMGGTIHSTTLLPGEYVNKGAVLATIENPDFINLQQTFLDAVAQTEYLKQEYERQQTLSLQEAASQKRFQQSKADYLSMKSKLEASKAQLQILGVDPMLLQTNGIETYLTVKAPISGFISSMDVNLGKYLNAGDALCNIINKGETMLNLTAYEKDLPNLKVGSRLKFHVNGMGKEVFYATIVSVGQEVNKTTRAIEVYARISKSDARFRPGMYVAAKIEK